MAAEAHSPALRASDSDREHVVELLSTHAAAGRLNVDELSGRIDAAYAAVTLKDLEALSADLPDLPAGARVAGPASTSPEEAEVRRELRSHVITFALVMVLLVAIWILTGMGYFWPVWPFLGWGSAVAMDALRTRSEIGEIRAASPDERGKMAARNAKRRQAGRHRHAGHGPRHGSRSPRH